MDYTPRDLGETPKTPDMSNFKNPLMQASEGSIFIESFNITPLNLSEKGENLTEIIKKESRDSSI
ncbi:hypothetical protein [[Flexibacter] sp. ATCC 35103]|uniref:hypothetical protein n=1 Tax=[Flexibacter] sp. ATCC 35103 TaxID=1937528 RepID=UPI0009C62F08|nr:hypothetical protein [[Flexibacter] sp. ATCC 35103]OMQ11829.1 hypothetical protein BXU01_09930 [[Flexibacter] sp. ATCC 35103]